MATQPATTSHQTPSDDKPIESKVNERVKPLEQETVSLTKKSEEEEEENLEAEETKDKQIESPTIAVKTVDVPVVDNQVEDTVGVEKGYHRDSLIPSVPDPEADTANSQLVAELATDKVMKEADNQPVTASLERVQQEQPKMVDVIESTEETVEKQQEPAEVLAIKNSEVIEAKKIEYSAPSNDVDKPGLAAAEVRTKPEEHSAVAKEVGQTKSDEPIGTQQEPSEVIPIITDAVVVKHTEDSAAVSVEADEKESETPEVEVKPKEQSELSEQVEKPGDQSAEAVEKTLQPLEVPAVEQSSALTIKNICDTEAASKELDQPESVVPEVEVKVEEQIEVAKQVEKPEAVVPEVEVKVEEPIEVAKQVEKPESVVPEVEVKEKEHIEVTKQVEKLESVVPEVEVKEKEHIEVTKQVEKLESVVTKQVEKLESVVPEAEVKAEEQIEGTKQVEKLESAVPEDEKKPEEQSEITKQVANPELVVPEAEVKQEEQSEVTKQVEIKSVDEKSEPVEADVEEQLVGQTTVTGQTGHKWKEVEPKGITEGKTVEDETISIDKVDETSKEENPKSEEAEPKGCSKDETVKGDGTLANKVEDIPSLKEEANKDEKPNADIPSKQQALPDLRKDEGESSLPDFAEQAVVEDEKANSTDVVEVSSKEVVVDTEKVGEETEAKTIKTESAIVGKEAINEELAQPIKMEDVNNAVSSAKVIERSLEGERREKGTEKVEDSKEEESIKLEIPASDKTSKDEDEAGKLDEATKAVSEAVEESKDSESEGKSAQTKEDELEKAEENLESSKKDGGDTKISQDLPREAPAKPTQKQSSNILTKVKRSLVKAKKAIIGKSPSPKTLSSDTKDDIKVK